MSLKSPSIITTCYSLLGWGKKLLPRVYVTLSYCIKEISQCCHAFGKYSYVLCLGWTILIVHYWFRCFLTVAAYQVCLHWLFNVLLQITKMYCSILNSPLCTGLVQPWVKGWWKLIIILEITFLVLEVTIKKAVFSFLLLFFLFS